MQHPSAAAATTTMTTTSTTTRNSSNNKRRRCPPLLPLDGVTACLSGLAADEKERHHAAIERLGGRYARDFVVVVVASDNNANNNNSSRPPTHLIAAAASGAKFDAAVQLLRMRQQAAAAAESTSNDTTTTTTTATIHIVSPQWVEACARAQRRVPERDYYWLVPALQQQQHDGRRRRGSSAVNEAEAKSFATGSRDGGGDGGGGANGSNSNNRSEKDDDYDDERPEPASLQETLQDLLHNNDDDLPDQNWFLFSRCHFYFIMGENGERENSNNNSSNTTTTLLQRLIRRGMGTIHWNNHGSDPDIITHVIVIAGVAAPAQFAGSSTAANKPSFVSPEWIVDSCKAGSLQNTNRYPPPQFQTAPKKQGHSQTISTSTSNNNKNPKRRPATLFGGAVFVLARTAPPPGAVDWDAQVLRDLAVAHGGTMLTAPLLEALQKDYHRQQQQQRRICYTVRWGGSGGDDNNNNPDEDEDDDDALHPLLQRAKQICQVENVTPLWLQTCATEERWIEPRRFPELFRPSAKPVRSFVAGTGNNNTSVIQKKKNNDNNNNNINKKAKIVQSPPPPPPPRVSVTGFTSAAQRTALRHLIEAMGAVYDDALRKSTTHLIVNTTTAATATGATGATVRGPKYETAVQWKLHTVTLDWLYHVAEHGWNTTSSGSRSRSSSKNKSDRERCSSSEDRFAVIPPPPSDSAIEEE